MKRFIKYIIKRIVKVVYVNDHLDVSLPYSDWYRIEKVSIDDDVLKDIIDEGKLYGYTKQECLSFINVADQVINFTPSVDVINSYLDISSLSNGIHVKFHFENSTFGILTIDAIKESNNEFFILKSDVAALCWGDSVVFTIHRLQIGTYPVFCVFRNGNAISPSNCFCPGKLCFVELFAPGITHAIIDSKSEFKKSKSAVAKFDSASSVSGSNEVTHSKRILKPVKKSEKSEAVVGYPNVHYLWPPSRFNPISFCFTDKDFNVNSPDYPPYMAIVASENSMKAELTINTCFIKNILESDIRTKSSLFLLESVIDVCELNGPSTFPELVSEIHVVSNGVLKRESKFSNNWILDVAPIISVR